MVYFCAKNKSSKNHFLRHWPRFDDLDGPSKASWSSMVYFWATYFSYWIIQGLLNNLVHAYIHWMSLFWKENTYLMHKENLESNSHRIGFKFSLIKPQVDMTIFDLNSSDFFFRYFIFILLRCFYSILIRHLVQ